MYINTVTRVNAICVVFKFFFNSLKTIYLFNNVTREGRGREREIHVV